MSAGPEALRTALADITAEGVDDAQTTITNLRERLAGTEITVDDGTAIGIFNFAYQAMVEDLAGAREMMAANPLICALAGDPEARAQLHREVSEQSLVDMDDLDKIAPVDEPFVLDSDPTQARSIHSILNGTGHAVIDGPPGTGKSQTIANLIAALIARGQRVLFVAEKRAALDVVHRRLQSVDLGSLVLDLHGSNVTRKRSYAQLRMAKALIANSQPVISDPDAELLGSRDRLNAHRRFMHSPIAPGSMSPFQLLSARAALPATVALDLRFSPEELRRLSRARITELCRDALDPAAQNADLFLRRSTIPWACCGLNSDELPDAFTRLISCTQTIDGMRAAMIELQVVAETRLEFFSQAQRLRSIALALQTFRPSIFEVSQSDIAESLRATKSLVGSAFAALNPATRRAMRAVKAHCAGDPTPRTALHDALAIIAGLDSEQSRVARMMSAPGAAKVLGDSVDIAWSRAEQILGAQLPDDISTAISWLQRSISERNTAYRAAEMHKLERQLNDAGLAQFLSDLTKTECRPDQWSTALEAVWLDSQIETLRPAFASFNGRLHDAEVRRFNGAEFAERSVSAQRVLRAVAERRVRTAREHADQESMLAVELGRAKSKKSLRDLATAAPDAFLSLTPCVMASPLTVSQFLPRAALFDVCIFDEASQVTPAVAIATILRGKRLVVAGDEWQLPPTDFFAHTAENEEDEEEDTVGGYESILTAVAPFSASLRLRVHYRSLDEHLIAFSNHEIYGDELITFPGALGDSNGVNHVFVPPAFDDIDAESASAEVRRVVDLAIEHAENRPDESLGIIALGVKHARRVQAELDVVLKERPDLDRFFQPGESPAPFFVKNLERVQGDERDAIIFTVGYGRTKGGDVSHNFGPVNQAGGERRINVAVTRAKTRLTAVSSFREKDLDPTRLTSRGASLLGKYLGYCESRGRDLRDEGAVAISSNPFEAEIAAALTKRLGLKIVPQYGVGGYRIDLAVQHPEEPGRYVLAIECDGAAYHSSPTARMRDRQRQERLEDRGWRFCRIWSTDWFNDPEVEIARVGAMYRAALTNDATPEMDVFQSGVVRVTPVLKAIARGPRPYLRPYEKIDDLTDGDLSALLSWIRSDGRLRTDDEQFEDMYAELKFKRRGTAIVARLQKIIRTNITR